MTKVSEPRATDLCKNCGKPLTVNDKVRNRGTGLCWDCLSTSPQAGAAAALGESSKLTSSDPGAVLRSAAAFVMSQGKWEITYQTEDTLVLRHRSGASPMLGCLLLLLALLPGIIYWAFARGVESTLSVRVTPVGSGSRVAVSWANADWRLLAGKFLEPLPQTTEEELTQSAPPQQAVPSSEPAPPSVEAAPSADIPNQLRQLAELRDKGIITEDEFEAKKKDLLSRM